MSKCSILTLGHGFSLNIPVFLVGVSADTPIWNTSDFNLENHSNNLTKMTHCPNNPVSQQRLPKKPEKSGFLGVQKHVFSGHKNQRFPSQTAPRVIFRDI